MTLSLSRIESALNASNDSAQSPACKRNALPFATLARSDVRLRASPAKTNGGIALRRLTTSLSASAFTQSGCCTASRSFQDDGDHSLVTTTRLIDLGPSTQSHYWRGSDQTASMVSGAFSRTEAMARFTRRRAASAVTPSSSPTSR